MSPIPLTSISRRSPGRQIDARDVVAQVLLGHVEDLPALCPLVFHDHAHGRRLGHRVRPQAANLGRCPVGVGQDKDRRDPFDRLEGERPLLLEFLSAAVAAGQQLGVPRLGLRHAAFGPLRVLLDLGGGPADLLVGLGEQFGQRQLDVVGDPVHLGEPFGADLVEERPQPVFVQPGRGFRQVGDGRAAGRATRLG